MTLTFNGPRQGSLQHIHTSMSVTIHASYVPGGMTLTPQQLGLTNFVIFGIVNVRTASATGPSGGVLDCTNQPAPKLELVNAGATGELAAGAASGAASDIVSVSG